MNFLSFEVLTGRTQEHIGLNLRIGVELHHGVQSAFLRLMAEAKKEGFELAPLSGFRSYEKQLAIWNAKASGKRTLLDDHGDPLEFSSLTPEELCLAIMRWSALPGMSRHHWGTDLDVIDRLALPSPDYQVQLVPEEVDAGGIFAPMHEWLDELIEAGEAFGFYRPYDEDRNGVAPERWHLSYRPIAHLYEAAMNEEVWLKNLENTHLQLRETLKQHPEWFARFVVR
jgi:LAS superfamily LD-carboxypeptidase LdcB